MQTIETSPQRAEDVLVELAGHLPPAVPIGRPMVVTGHSPGCPAEAGPVYVEACETVLTDTAVWFLEPGAAVRMVTLSDGRAELTRWRHGVEVERTVTGSP